MFLNFYKVSVSTIGPLNCRKHNKPSGANWYVLSISMRDWESLYKRGKVPVDQPAIGLMDQWRNTPSYKDASKTCLYVFLCVYVFGVFLCVYTCVFECVCMCLCVWILLRNHLFEFLWWIMAIFCKLSFPNGFEHSYADSTIGSGLESSIIFI